MKKIIFATLSLVLSVFAFTACDNTYDDLMTANVKTGGILVPTDVIPYKLGGTESFDVTLDIPKGPGIESVEIYRTYTDKTVKVLDQTINIASANADGELSKTVTYTYEDLIVGLDMPADEAELNIGDAWTLSYVSVMEDGRKVDVSSKTLVSVANFFAGKYSKDMKYFHPTAGGSYPDDPYSAYVEDVNLVAISAYVCSDWFGTWENTHVYIQILPDNSVTLTFEDRDDVGTGDPNDATKVCSYDPATGVIKLYYFYPGSGGNRIFWVVYTPK